MTAAKPSRGETRLRLPLDTSDGKACLQVAL
jgi:hypothetical protein